MSDKAQYAIELAQNDIKLRSHFFIEHIHSPLGVDNDFGIRKELNLEFLDDKVIIGAAEFSSCPFAAVEENSELKGAVLFLVEVYFVYFALIVLIHDLGDNEQLHKLDNTVVEALVEN